MLILTQVQLKGALGCMRVLELRVLEELVTQWKEMSEREILCFDTQAKQLIEKGR